MTAEPTGQQPDREEKMSSREREVLLSQAKSAADQAIELAKLAKESARLARDLNARAAGVEPVDLSDIRLPDIGPAYIPKPEKPKPVPPPPIPEPLAIPNEPDDFSRLASAATKTAPVAQRKSRKKKKHQDRLRASVERSRRKKISGKMPRRLKIKVKKGDLDRPEGLIPFLTQNWNSMTISGGVICIVLFLLALKVLPVIADEQLNTVMASFAEEEAVVVEDTPTEEPEEEPGEQLEEKVEEPEEMPEPEPEPEPEPMPIEEPEPAEEMPAEEVPAEMPINENSDAPPADVGPAVDFSKTGSRSDAAKQALLKKYGGTAASESAVGNALDWFVRYQARDGSWNFTDVGASGNAGTVNNRVGATSYVMLCFLGAGQTHFKGKYKRQVKAGLDFILRNGRQVPGTNMIDLSGESAANDDTHNRFYVHGAATMVLTESYSMTEDRRLKSPAQAAVNALINSQDPRGGGWRYVPQEPGSTSVTGLQVAALYSAKKARLKVPKRCFDLATVYFNSVQSDSDGARYGYTAAKPTYKSSVTAIAILCRMYLGWNRETPQLKQGIELLDNKGPDSDSLYYVYYATQAMRNWGGPEWERWNDFVREKLVRTQEVEGDARGSWKPRNRALEAKAGGRLFMTCLATLTLEVYYRYLPLLDDLEKEAKVKK